MHAISIIRKYGKRWWIICIDCDKGFSSFTREETMSKASEHVLETSDNV